MSINNSLLKSMQTIVDKSIEIAPFDKTRQAQVIANNADGTYVIRLDGVLYGSVISYPRTTSITEGSVVKIVMPSNQPSQMYIIAPKGGGGGSGDHLEITQEDYDDLPADKKQGDTVFFVTESEPEYLIMSDSVPIGAIQSYGGNVAPSGWLICDGRAISRTEYSELFYAIGTTYGSGNGSTTFNIPDLKGRTLVGVGNSGATGATNHTLGQKSGEEKHTLTVDEMPSHNHRMQQIWMGYNVGTVQNGSYYGMGIGYKDSDYTGGGQSHNNMQPYTVVNYIIKAKQPPTENVIKGLDPQEVLIDAFYPVGTEYSTTNSVFDPNVTWGGTWTKTTISDDEIVEQGTSGIWTYRKWKSGIAECWGIYTKNITGWNSWGNLYEGTPGFYVNYPSGLFINNPTVEITVQSVDTGTAGIEHFSGGTKDRTGNIYPLRPLSGSTSDIPIGLLAKGTWKTYTIPTVKYVWHRTA